jgi:CBS domain-containing protein
MKPDPATVAPETYVVDAARIMLALHVSGLPVVEAGHLVGMITEGDLLRRNEIDTAPDETGWWRSFFTPSRLAEDYVHSHGRHVREVMSAKPVSVTPATPLAEAVTLLLEKKFKRLPVVQGDTLVGMLCRADLLGALVHKMIALPKATDDAGAKAYIEKELASHSWTPKQGVRVQVRDHVAILEGSIFADAERQAVLVIAENAPGVAKVVDNLVYVDPGSGLAFPAA